MIRYLSIFCFLVLLIFSCRSSKKAVVDDPAVVECKLKARIMYTIGENHFLSKEYDLARFRYADALADSCLVGMKVTYSANKRFRKKEILITDLIAQRIKQIDKMRVDEIREKQEQCSKIFQYAERLCKEQDYIKSKGYYERYKNSDCSPNDSIVDSRIKLLDSLINLKKN